MDVSQNIGSMESHGEGLHDEVSALSAGSAEGAGIPGSEAVAGLPGPSGDELIRSISAITGLAEHSVKSEVTEMLALSGQPAHEGNLSSLSLDQLRAAMLVYLETINADMESSEALSSVESTNS
jgi:hypothetical protein